jgi:hypothetical protein
LITVFDPDPTRGHIVIGFFPTGIVTQPLGPLASASSVVHHQGKQRNARHIHERRALCCHFCTAMDVCDGGGQLSASCAARN